VPPIPVVFDTDIGTNVDDALALALALASPEIRLDGVTVVNGDAPVLQTRARIAARLLGLAGRSDVPVFLGHPQQLSETGCYTHLGDEGEGLLDVPFDGRDATISDTPAVDWLALHAREERFHLVATGPFTNVALALQRDPSLAQRLAHLSVMGGMVHPENFGAYWQEWLLSGNRGAQLDYNTACDPAAALCIAQSGVDITWVPIEVTLRAGMTAAALDRLRDAHSPFCDALHRLISLWSQRHYRHREHGLPDAVANYHDPLAMATVFGAPGLTLRHERLRYGIEDGLFRARPTAADDADAHEATVAVDVDPAAFEAAWLQRVLGRFGRVVGDA
jgi:purine nucleosidase